MNPKYIDEYRMIGLKISYYRKLRGLTQEELAEKTDLSAGYIGHLEAYNIDKAPSLDTIFAIANARCTIP